MISPAPRIIPPTTVKVKTLVINTDKSGVNKLSNTSGITFLSNLSNLAKIYEAANTGKTVPWYPTFSIVIPNIFQVGNVPFNTASPYPYPFSKSGCTIIIPITAPKYGFPPNNFVAEKPTNIGKNEYAALASIFIKLAKSPICGYISINDFPSTKSPWDVNTLFKPINNPLATSAGNIGTNTSAKIFIISLCFYFCFCRLWYTC